MLIMGVDPGTAITGFGLIQYYGNHFSLVECGCIRTPAGEPMAERLQTLYRGLVDIISRNSPEQFALEELFFNKNTRTALAVGHARGVAMLAAAESGLPVFEYTPLQVKQAVAGYGRAGKTQVQFMVKTILAMPDVPAPDDVADALAVAICHAHIHSYERKLK
ncbi:MAG: crossover junction endodeoxyribonuclease RuvC [Desulfotomaculaceae bacterium]|nr:crossover junction endodeoxyribonuclease RuvC [Desulfotomaculaceae bacterium]